ncbi:ATP-dependent DNA ligase [Streptomyces pseudogriseolus]|uniref:ATP-dependent DNA ligase n=1 Tax=Streptomyces pseudogriseolus TaxID=36817 RepID=UPI003FA1B32F
MTASFPEIRSAALAQLPTDTGIDGEVVVWERDRLAFERLQQRLARRGAAAAQAAREWPAHFVAFDLLHRGNDLTGWPYARRRAALEELFAERGLTAPFTLCPSTTDPALARSGCRGRRPGWRDCASSGWRSPIAGACGRGGSTRTR